MSDGASFVKSDRNPQGGNMHLEGPRLHYLFKPNTLKNLSKSSTYSIMKSCCNDLLAAVFIDPSFTCYFYWHALLALQREKVAHRGGPIPTL